MRLTGVLASVFAATTALVLTLAGVSTASTAAQPPPAHTYVVYGSGATLLNTFTFTAREDGSPRRAGGYVAASPTGLKGVQDNNGRVVCLDVRGDTFGLIYHYDDTAHAGPLPGRGLFLYVTGIDDGPGGLDYAGIAGPAPLDLNLGCAPNPALNDFGPVVRGGLTIREVG